MSRNSYSDTLDPNQNARAIEIDGKEYSTGLMTPDTRPLTFNPLSSVMRPLTKNQIVDWIHDPRRAPSIEIFPAEQYGKNQGRRGACNGFAGASALEKSEVLLGLPYQPLSGEGLYSLVNGGRDSGSMLDAGMRALTETGVPLQSLVPHEEYKEENISGEAWASADGHKGRECYRLDAEMDMASALASNFMVVVAVHAGRNFMRVDRDGVIGSDNGNGNHAVHLSDIRIKDGVLQYQLDNSWGLDWAVNGSAWTSFRQHYARTIRSHTFYAIRSVKRA